jgi:hypothetical protein
MIIRNLDQPNAQMHTDCTRSLKPQCELFGSVDVIVAKKTGNVIPIAQQARDTPGGTRAAADIKQQAL